MFAFNDKLLACVARFSLGTGRPRHSGLGSATCSDRWAGTEPQATERVDGRPVVRHSENGIIPRNELDHLAEIVSP